MGIYRSTGFPRGLDFHAMLTRFDAVCGIFSFHDKVRVAIKVFILD